MTTRHTFKSNESLARYIFGDTYGPNENQFRIRSVLNSHSLVRVTSSQGSITVIMAFKTHRELYAFLAGIQTGGKFHHENIVAGLKYQAEHIFNSEYGLFQKLDEPNVCGDQDDVCLNAEILYENCKRIIQPN